MLLWDWDGVEDTFLLGDFFAAISFQISFKKQQPFNQVHFAYTGLMQRVYLGPLSLEV